MSAANIPDPRGAWLQSAPGQKFHATLWYLPGHWEKRPVLTYCGRSLACTEASKVKILVGTEDACQDCARKIAQR